MLARKKGRRVARATRRALRRFIDRRCTLVLGACVCECVHSGSRFDQHLPQLGRERALRRSRSPRFSPRHRL